MVHPITLVTVRALQDTIVVVYNLDVTRTSGNLPHEVSIKDNVHKRKDTRLDFSYVPSDRY